MASDHSFKNTFLTQLMSINIRSREFPETLAKMLASQEGINIAMSLQGDDALTLVDILDQAFEAPGMDLDLRRKSVRILQRVCGSQTILPRSCIISEGISKEGDIAFASGDFADVWKSRHNGSRVCIKAFRTYPVVNLSKIKQRLFQEIVIWRRLSHPNVLPVLGVSPRLFPLCVITEWMIDGNIMDFTSKHPDANRLRLLKLSEAASGLHYLHSMDIIHSDLKPPNILIDREFRPRLTDYGLISILSDPNTADPDSTSSVSPGTVRYAAPELLNPSGFGLKNSRPTKKSDIYAFGVVTYQVTTGEQPFPGDKDGEVIYNVVNGGRPKRPQSPSEWVSDDVWNFISRCWSPSWDGRPDISFAINLLDDVADTATTNDQGKTTLRPRSGVLPPSNETPSPFVTITSTGPGEKEQKESQLKIFRLWHDSTGFYRPEAAPADHRAGIIQLEPWEADLLAFFRERKLGVEDSLEERGVLWDCFGLYNSGVKDSPEMKKARRFANRLDLALDSGSLPRLKRTRHLRYLRKLCGTFGILPSSFVLAPRSVKCAVTPFATGGFSDVYEATFKRRPVLITRLKVTTAGDPEKVHKLLAKEVVGWKWLRHENILPFVGVMFTPPLISIVSARMENGNIMDFIKTDHKYNRLHLLVGAVTGLKFLHEHDIVHGDLKGANILIDSDCCARLADFGLAVVVGETGTRELKGTIRWMAPELMDPEPFGFTGETLKQLPSKGTDIYAIGMTILEVLTGCRPFSDITRTVTVICKVMKGERPDRPPLGFPDALWDLVNTTWVEQRVNQPQSRPLVSTVLNRLKERADQWDKSIVPVVPKRWRESVTITERENGRAETLAPNSSQMASAAPPSPQTHDDYEKITQRRPVLTRIANELRDALGLN